MKSVNWQRNSISAAVSAVLCTMAVAPAFAADDTLEEVIVTGIRGSLKQSMDIKKDSVGVVDAITAEDMGKFPDTNLAESLQRITGVSIDRNNGEGKNVTVRGFGGGFNLVTLNGRQLPSASVGTITGNGDDSGAQGTSRSFDFSTLASEGVSGVQVYKTGNATQATGGIGATINISTVKPLEAGNRASIGVKADHEAGGKKNVTPELSGLWSWTNDAKTWGVSAFASYQDRSFGSRSVAVSNFWFAKYAHTGPFATAAVDNEPAAGTLIATPANLNLNDAHITRKRTNGMVTLQFAPDENTTFTADALYTINKLSGDNLATGIWFNQNFSYVKFDGSHVVDTPTLMVESLFSPASRGKDYFNASYDQATKDTLSAYGFNVKHKMGDFAIEADLATATSKSGGDGPPGGGNPFPKNSWRMNLASAGAGWQGVNYGGGVPNATVGVTENLPSGANGNGVLDIPDESTQTMTTEVSNQKTKTDQFNLSGSWDNHDGISAKLGLGEVRTSMDQYHVNTTDYLGGWGVGCVHVTGGCVTDLTPAAQALVKQVNLISDFKYLNVGSGYPNAAGVAPAGYYLTPLGREGFQIPVVKFLQAMNGYVPYDANGVALQPPFDINNLGIGGSGYDNNTIAENVTSLYGQVKMDGEIAGHKTQTVAGLRYEKTTLTSTTRQAIPDTIIWKSDNDFVTHLGPNISSLNESNSYTNVLPNIDFVFDITHSLKARASVSKTIARPQYDRMFLKTAVGTNPTPGLLGGQSNASSGTAKLAPLESTNFDFSLEWYYGDSDYASIGYFTKDVNNFLGTQVVKRDLFGLRDVSAGPIAQAAAAALTAGGYTVNEPNLFTMAAILANPQDFPTGAAAFLDPATAAGSAQQFDVLGKYDLSPTGADPLIQFNLAIPVNNRTAKLHGVEAAWQHFFGHSGFGFQANATFVGGDVGYNLAADPTVDQFALEGLSNSANLVLIYEKHGWSSRVAYNWRDAFLAETVHQGNQGKPGFVAPHRQIDFNVTYNFNDHLSVGLDGVNVTHEGFILYSRTRNMQWTNAEQDPRYLLSANYKF
jgi:TonB-dependent receptor